MLEYLFSLCMSVLSKMIDVDWSLALSCTMKNVVQDHNSVLHTWWSDFTRETCVSSHAYGDTAVNQFLCAKNNILLYDSMMDPNPVYTSSFPLVRSRIFSPSYTM